MYHRDPTHSIGSENSPPEPQPSQPVMPPFVTILSIGISINISTLHPSAPLATLPPIRACPHMSFTDDGEPAYPRHYPMA